jgi:excisionase family DNA binding protein
MADEALLTVRETAEMLGMTEKEVLDLAQSQALPAEQIDGSYMRFPKNKVLEYKQAHGITSAQDAAQDDEGDKILDFFYLNDFYIYSFAIIAVLLVLIFRGY